MPDSHHESAGATEWTPAKCLEFVADEGAVRNTAYLDKRAIVSAALIEREEALRLLRWFLTYYEQESLYTVANDASVLATVTDAKRGR